MNDTEVWAPKIKTNTELPLIPLIGGPWSKNWLQHKSIIKLTKNEGLELRCKIKIRTELPIMHN